MGATPMCRSSDGQEVPRRNVLRIPWILKHGRKAVLRDHPPRIALAERPRHNVLEAQQNDPRRMSQCLLLVNFKRHPVSQRRQLSPTDWAEVIAIAKALIPRPSVFQHRSSSGQVSSVLNSMALDA